MIRSSAYSHFKELFLSESDTRTRERERKSLFNQSVSLAFVFSRKRRRRRRIVYSSSFSSILCMFISSKDIALLRLFLSLNNSSHQIDENKNNKAIRNGFFFLQDISRNVNARERDQMVLEHFPSLSLMMMQLLFVRPKKRSFSDYCRFSLYSPTKHVDKFYMETSSSFGRFR